MQLQAAEHNAPSTSDAGEAAAWQHRQSSATSTDLGPELVLSERVLLVKSSASQSYRLPFKD